MQSSMKGFEKRCAANAQLMAAVRRVYDAVVEAPPTPPRRNCAAEGHDVNDALMANRAAAGRRRRLYDPTDLEKAKEWVKGLAGDTKATARAQLETLERQGEFRDVAYPPDPSSFEQLLRTFPNFDEPTLFVQRRAVLSRLVPEAPFTVPPLLLCGPPGVGKTEYAKRLARLLGVEVRVVDASTISSPHEMSGLDLGYSTGRPGLIWQTLAESTSASVCLVLDEVDKIESADHGSFLFSVLEPNSARQYIDAAIRIPLDASFLMWIATCNYLDKVDAALRSRFRVVHIAVPTGEECRAVVHSVHDELLASETWGRAFSHPLDESIIDALASRTPREIRQGLEDAYANAATAGRKQLLLEDVPPPGSTRLKRSRIGFI